MTASFLRGLLDGWPPTLLFTSHIVFLQIWHHPCPWLPPAPGAPGTCPVPVNHQAALPSGVTLLQPLSWPGHWHLLQGLPENIPPARTLQSGRAPPPASSVLTGPLPDEAQLRPPTGNKGSVCTEREMGKEWRGFLQQRKNLQPWANGPEHPQGGVSQAAVTGSCQVMPQRCLGFPWQPRDRCLGWCLSPTNAPLTRPLRPSGFLACEQDQLP